MANVNMRVENRFKKKFENNSYISDIMAKYPFLANFIKKEMQEIYDIGHSDGFADAIFTP